MDNFSVNYLAVLLSSIVAFAIGAVWYSPALFFKPWATASFSWATAILAS